jgi:cysteine-S-conjugate beta-lyase
MPGLGVKIFVMKYNFDLTPDRRNSHSLKWQTYNPDVIPMWVADMDFPSPQPVIQALLDRVQHGVFGYPSGLVARPGEVSELRQILVDRLARLYGWHVDADAMVLMPGVVTSVNLACQAFAAPTGGVLVQVPVYPPILNAAHTVGAVSQEMTLSRRSDGTYFIDWDVFEAAMTSQTRLFLLCNPHNPVGRVFSPDELKIIAEICLRHGVIICSDEIHCDLIYSGQSHTPIASLDPEIASQTITLIAPSKTFNLAGLQCSIAIIQNAELRKQFVSAGKGLVPWVNLMGMVAAQTAYADGEEWLEQALNYLQGNRDYLVETMRRELPNIALASPEGTYLAWLDCRDAGIDGSPYQFFLEKARVAFNDGATFGSGNENFVRLNFGCSRSLLVEVVERMKYALQ